MFKHASPQEPLSWPWLALGAGLLLLLALGLVFPPLWLILAGLGAAGVLLKLAFAPQWAFKGALLTLFLGILLSVKVGFTLKAVQVFTLLGLFGLGVGTGMHWRVPKAPPWPWAIPFGLMLLSFLPSFFYADTRLFSLSQATAGIRLFFNAGLLFAFATFVVWFVSSKDRLLSAIHWGSLSLGLSLGVGFVQQFGYYAGWYNPLDFVGKHSVIVDFYGPFLRIAPGTFANEYGQILQNMGILTLGLLLLAPRVLSARQKWGYGLLFAVTSLALVLNFTRASWLIFVFSVFGLLVMSRMRLWLLTGLGVLLAALLYGLLSFGDILGEYNVLLSIGERFEELQNLSTSSAGLRLQAWQLAWDGFAKHPWVGNGLGIYVETHNVPLQLLAEAGLLGLMGYLGFCAWVLWTQVWGYIRATDPELKAIQQICIWAFLGCLAFDLTNHGLFHFVFWFVLALGLATARLNGYNESKNQRMSE